MWISMWGDNMEHKECRQRQAINVETLITKTDYGATRCDRSPEMSGVFDVFISVHINHTTALI